jgi:predicted Fe-Mo cluster-binding NifX family protein
MQMNIAVPVLEGRVSPHFGRSDYFVIFEIAGGELKAGERHTPPPHAPGVIPKWLKEKDADVVITGGIGPRALGIFAQYGIKVLTGAPNLEPEELIKQHLEGTLALEENICDH